MRKVSFEINVVGDAHDVIDFCDMIMDSISPVNFVEVDVVVRNEGIVDDA